MNIQYFAAISAAYINPTAYGDFSGANFWVWFIDHLLADEKFVTIFSMLFGGGIVLMTSHIEAAGKRSAPLHYRRMGWLILFGMMHGYLIWSGDILFSYGICGLVVFLFRKLQPRTLIILGLLTIAVATVFNLEFALSSQNWTPAELKDQIENFWMPTPEMVQKEISAYRGNWMAQMSARVPDTAQMESVFLIAFTFWRVSGLMLIGMALFKLGVLSAKRQPSFYWTLIGVALVIGIPLIAYGTSRDLASGWDFREAFFYGSQFNYWASLLVSLGWVGAVMLACKSVPMQPLTRRLGAVGRMAFSNYIVQTLICTTLFYGHGFGLFGKVDRVSQIEIVFVIWILLLTVSPVWFRYFLFGPLEWLWRSLTYWQREPFRRKLEARPSPKRNATNTPVH